MPSLLAFTAFSVRLKPKILKHKDPKGLWLKGCHGSGEQKIWGLAWGRENAKGVVTHQTKARLRIYTISNLICFFLCNNFVAKIQHISPHFFTPLMLKNCLLKWLLNSRHIGRFFCFNLKLFFCLFRSQSLLWPFIAAKSLQSCPTLCDPIDGSPSGSPVPGILQARTLEWVAISFC